MTHEKEDPAGTGGAKKEVISKCCGANSSNKSTSEQDTAEAQEAEKPSPVPPAPDPWPEPVHGADLLDEVTDTFKSFLSLPNQAAEVMALWAVGTHVFDAAETFPRLVFWSPLPECGKTTALSLLTNISHRGVMASNMSSAVIFRLIEAERPALFLDEADTYIDIDDGYVGLLNSGHTRSSASFWRCDPKSYKPQKFSTWAPLAIAKIGPVRSDALRSRSIEIKMQRARRDEDLQQFRESREKAIIHKLARKAARWAQDHLLTLREVEPNLPDVLANRARDNWHLLISIADAAGGHWPETARKAAVTFSSGAAERSQKEYLLAAIAAVFRDHTERDWDRISSDELCKAVRKVDDQLEGLEPRELARLLKPFGIAPRTIRIGDKTPKGYRRNDFDDVFARYPPPDRNTATSEDNQ